jgi:hypothetical protein
VHPDRLERKMIAAISIVAYFVIAAYLVIGAVAACIEFHILEKERRHASPPMGMWLDGDGIWLTLVGLFWWIWAGMFIIGRVVDSSKHSRHS